MPGLCALAAAPLAADARWTDYTTFAGLENMDSVTSAGNVAWANTLAAVENADLAAFSSNASFIMAQVGDTLTASTGNWSHNPSSFTWQWNRVGSGPIVGATAAQYAVVAADIGFQLTASVIATNPTGHSLAATSLPTAAVVDMIPTINTPASIPGTPQVGSPITAVQAAWNNTVTSRAWQWKVGGVNATGAGATTLTYTPAVGDLGQTLTLTEIATNSGGPSAPSTSAPSAAVIAAGGPSGLNIDIGVGVGEVPTDL